MALVDQNRSASDQRGVIRQCLVQKGFQIVNARKLPSFGQEKSFEELFYGLLKIKSGSFRILNAEETFYSPKILLGNA